MRFTAILFVALAVFAHYVQADGACNNAADLAKGVNNKDTIKPYIQKCATSCLTAGDIASCSSKCLTQSAGVSDACSQCFGAEVKCTKDKCLLQCISPESDACVQCSIKNCISPFNTCSGLNSSNNAINGDACTNSADMAKGVSKREQIQPVVQKCAQSCITASDMGACASQCLQKQGLSAGCSDCFGADVTCTKDKCLIQCINPTSQGCVDCSLKNCAAPFDACSGLKTAVLAEINAINGAACTNAADMAKGVSKREQIQPVVQKCAQSCITASDMGACASQCLQKQGLSAGCSDCFGADVTCTKDKCLVQCINPASQGCVDCSLKNCAAPFDACSGLKTAVLAEINAINGAACTNADDLAKGVANKDQIKPVVQKCAQSCITASNMGTCASQCLQKQGLSAGCSDCFGADVECTKDKCMFQCIDPTSQGCLDCSMKNCAAPFDACSGLKSAVLAEINAINGDACTNSADMAKGVANKDQIKPVVQKCASSCITASDMGACASQCLQKQGLSAGCSDCFGADVECTKDKCMFQCIDPSSQGCLDCSLKNCAAPFDACSGLKSAVLAEINAINGAACTDSADKAKASNHTEISSELSTCSKSCYTSSDFESCVTTCMTGTPGLSQACATCFGADALCTKNNCFSQCATDPTGSSCESCSNQYCLSDFESCSGLTSFNKIILNY